VRGSITIFIALAGTALSAGGAWAESAQDSAFAITTEYGQTHVNGATANSWGAAPSAIFGTGLGHLLIEADGSYRWQLDRGGTPPATGRSEAWSGGGSVLWHFDGGRFGASGEYAQYQTPKHDRHIAAYGLFYEWWPASWITLGAKGGLVDEITANRDGGYAGGELAISPIPDIVLRGTADFTRITNDDRDQYTGEFELLPVRSVPFVFFGDYVYDDYHQDARGSNWSWVAGIRFIFNLSGQESLTQRERTGPLGWAGGYTLDRPLPYK